MLNIDSGPLNQLRFTGKVRDHNLCWLLLEYRIHVGQIYYTTNDDDDDDYVDNDGVVGGGDDDDDNIHNDNDDDADDDDGEEDGEKDYGDDNDGVGDNDDSIRSRHHQYWCCFSLHVKYIIETGNYMIPTIAYNSYVNISNSILHFSKRLNIHVHVHS